VAVKVYTVLAQEVTTLVNEVNQPGRYSVQWNVPQSGMASGVPARRSDSKNCSGTQACISTGSGPAKQTAGKLGSL